MTNPYEDFTRHPLRGIFAPVVWWRSYSRILYLLIGFPLGLAYFIFYVTGFALGIGLLIVAVGLLVLALIVLAARPLGSLERLLAVHLIGVPIPAPRLPAFSTEDPWTWIRAAYASGSTWKALLFLVLKFPLGLASWLAAFVGLVVSLTFVAAPIVIALGGEAGIDLGFWSPATPREALPLVPIGLAGYLVIIHLLNGLAWMWGRLARALLGGAEPAVPETPAAVKLAA